MRAFRILAAISAILAAGVAAQSPPVTVNITGNLSQIAGSPQPYGGLNIQLQNCPGPVSITGYSVIVQQALQLRADASGVINASIWPNDLITCNGTTGQSMYAMAPVVNGVPSQTSQCYQITAAQGVWNLNTQQPIACTQTPPNPQDAQYRNLNVTGCLSVQGGACGAGGGGTGVSGIVAGTNISISPSGGTGLVTINAAGGGSGGMIYPPSGVAFSIGSGWGSSIAVQGADTKLLSSGSVSGVGSLLCLDVQGGATTNSCATGIGLSPAPSAGLVYQISASPNVVTRAADFYDVAGLLGYTPLNPASNLTDVANALGTLTNLYSLGGLTSVQMIGTSSSGVPVPVTTGVGLSYTPAASSGGVIALLLTSGGTYSPTCPTISFSGGGGSGAQAYAECNLIRCIQAQGGAPAVCTYSIRDAVVTLPGAGYTSAPTITVGDGTGAAGFTALMGAAGIISTSSAIPQVGTPTAGHASCIKSAGPPVVIGYCSTQPDAGGACTCN